MKRVSESVWRLYRIEAILSLLGLALLAALINFTDSEWFSPSDTIQTMTLVVLVIVTVSYAKSTRKIYEVGLDAERNAVFPIIALTVEVTNQDQIYILYQNIGRGPALNLRIWLELESDDQFLYLKSEAMKSKCFHAALGVGQLGQHKWDNSEGALPTRSSGFDVVAEFTDVFSQSFVSKLQIINAYLSEFSFGKKRNQ